MRCPGVLLRITPGFIPSARWACYRNRRRMCARIPHVLGNGRALFRRPVGPAIEWASDACPHPACPLQRRRREGLKPGVSGANSGTDCITIRTPFRGGGNVAGLIGSLRIPPPLVRGLVDIVNALPWGSASHHPGLYSVGPLGLLSKSAPDVCPDPACPRQRPGFTPSARWACYRMGVGCVPASRMSSAAPEARTIKARSERSELRDRLHNNPNPVSGWRKRRGTDRFVTHSAAPCQGLGGYRECVALGFCFASPRALFRRPVGPAIEIGAGCVPGSRMSSATAGLYSIGPLGLLSNGRRMRARIPHVLCSAGGAND